MTDPQRDPQAGPYATAATRYLQSGWAPLPLPPKKKGPVPTGWTGRDGAWPSGPDVWAWTEDHPDGNLALRLPPTVLGIDVDAYGDKPGGLVFAHLEDDLGPLPPTWRSTSRDDGTSGIRLYRIPEGHRWPGILGPGIEVIRHAHRYTIAWPSVHPDTGSTYRWITPDGATALDAIPTPDDLPPLPPAWIEHFTKGDETEQARAGLDNATSSAWLTERGGGPTCRHTDNALTAALTDLSTGASRHDAALTATNRLVWLAGEGHTGATTALQQLGQAFTAATAGDRDPGEAEGEWDRMVLGAVDLAAAAHPDTPPPDPCTDPFAGLIPKEQQPWSNPTPAPAPTTGGNGSTPPPTADPWPTSSSAASDAGTSSEPTSPTDLEPAETERTSWWPCGLDATLDNDEPEPAPEFLTRSDGHGTWYRGRVNGIIGPSESGKTWVALHGLAQAVHAGHRVTILDFEDTERGVIGRLLALGLSPEQIRDHVAYIAPDEPFHPYLPTGRDLHEHLDQWKPDVLLLDGFNAAMTIQGLELMSNKDATSFFQQILNPLADRDITVAYVDHTPKDKANESSGGIGAQAKRSMTKGCTLRVDVIKPFGKGQEGRLRIIADKDRQGFVRGVSAPSKMGHWVGDVTVHSTADGDVRITFDPPEGFDPERPEQPATFRPTVLMGRVSTWLQDHPGAGRNEVIDGVTGNEKHVKTALRVLVEEGWVTIEKGRNNKSLHTFVAPFNELVGPPRDQWGPSGGQVGARPPVKTSGGGGGPDRDVVPSEPTPTQQVDDATDPVGVPGPHSHLVERIVAGQRVLYDPSTRQVINPTTGEVVP